MDRSGFVCTCNRWPQMHVERLLVRSCLALHWTGGQLMRVERLPVRLDKYEQSHRLDNCMRTRKRMRWSDRTNPTTLPCTRTCKVNFYADAWCGISIEGTSWINKKNQSMGFIGHPMKRLPQKVLLEFSVVGLSENTNLTSNSLSGALLVRKRSFLVFEKLRNLHSEWWNWAFCIWIGLWNPNWVCLVFFFVFFIIRHVYCMCTCIEHWCAVVGVYLHSIFRIQFE